MIHPLPPDADPPRVQCPVCRGHGQRVDPKCVPSFHVSPACLIDCGECDGTGWLTDDEADSLPQSAWGDD